jgi:hypothetical protein
MKSRKNESTLTTETVPISFEPSHEIIDAFARRLLPEIKKYFADELVQQEFKKWQEKQNLTDGK